MSGRFVRASKYRHVFGRSTKKEQSYDNLRISKNAWDTNLVKANPEYISVNWEASGGGAFAVIPVNERGKLPDIIPLFRGHTAAVLDTDWSPFDDSLIASASDDGKVLVWKVPHGFTLYQDAEDIQDVKPVGKLSGHTRKVGHVLFNPSAQNVLASSSGDYTIKLWDVGSGSSSLTLKHNDVIQSLSWSANGSLLVSTCRDKKLRIWDTRQQKAVVETASHSGAKNSRAVWLGEHDRVATTGFSKMSDRQMGLWDIRAAQAPIDGFTVLDQISGVCMPFWDEGTQLLYLAGKGDGNIRYYEYENDRFEYLSQHSANEPQRGIAFLPKRGVNTHENEVARVYRTVNETMIEPVSFIVPRRAEVFQNDIYPPTVGLKPSMSAQEWFSGKEGLPPKFSLESAFEGQQPEEVTSDYKAAPTPIRAASPPPPTQTRKEPEPPQPVVAPVARGPPPTMRENQASLSTMASKFADREDESSSSDDETSSFEEVPKPIERPRAAAAADVGAAPRTATPTPTLAPARSTTQPEPQIQRNTPAPTPSQAPAPAPTPILPPSSSSSSGSASPAEAAVPAPAPAPTGQRATSSGGGGPTSVAEALRTHLQDIKAMLEAQQQLIAAQNEKIEVLTKEVLEIKERL